MATNTNNGGASSRFYYYGEGPGQTDEEQDKTIVAIVVPVIIVAILVLRLLCSCLQKDSEEQDAGGPGSTSARQLRPSRQGTTEAGGRVVDRAPSSTVAGAGSVAEVAPAQAGEPPLVCTYMKADGWGEGTCGVCLADLADGDALRVLPACMHYFHAACVGEWLRAHGTCPLCRAPLVAPATAA